MSNGTKGKPYSDDIEPTVTIRQPFSNDRMVMRVLPVELVHDLCSCLAFCAWETHLTSQVVETDPAKIPGDPYEKAIIAEDATDAANQYAEAYQEARRLIEACGLGFDDLYPEAERPTIQLA